MNAKIKAMLGSKRSFIELHRAVTRALADWEAARVEAEVKARRLVPPGVATCPALKALTRGAAKKVS